MMPVDSSLLIEGLLTDVADVCIGKLLLRFKLDSRDVVDVGSYLELKLLCWM